MKKSDFYYYLPPELIAQTPLADRSASRLLVLNRKNGGITHTDFKNLGDYLNPGDCLVINDTKVLPARLWGISKTETRIEILLLKRTENLWEALARPGKKARTGDALAFGKNLTGKIVKTLENGNRLIEFSYQGVFEEVLDELGEMPLPPYITQKLDDKSRYQTVYAEHEGSAAAPTAGLHFTDGMLSTLQNNGIIVARLTLHVGLGTFRPVKAENIAEHHMHEEYFIIDAKNCDIINETRKSGGRVIAVGTTSCRTLETVADKSGFASPQSGNTGIFIYPGYNFKTVDGIITNFHLPESTLIMLVSAFSSREIILRAYEEAIKEGYRFFSFGDAMLIV